ncbi:MAG: hypothetical protein AB7K63_17230 [Vicinamibacterales bacterium]
MIRHHRLAASLATTLAVTLTLGLWLPGSRPTGRERPARRAARTGWSARSVGSAVWVVPDQEIGATTPGDGGDAARQRPDAPPGAIVTPPGIGPSPAVSALAVPRPPSRPGRMPPGPRRGRAPPHSTRS